MKLRTHLFRVLLLIVALMLFTGTCLADPIANPFVLAPKESIGKYGGTLYGAFPSGYRGQAWETMGFYEPILTWESDANTQVPNIVEAYEVSEDAKTFKMTIRKGLKWSNGDPVTTEDIRYAYEDVWHNKDLMVAFPTDYMSAGELCKLNIIDDATFELSFAAPNLTFNASVCRQGITGQLFMPSAYLKQFNNKHADEAKLNEMAVAEGYDNWVKLYEEKANWMLSPECPTLFAWQMESISEDGLVHVLQRNPYYHKVDTEGNQLPYIDTVQVEYVDNNETLKLKVMAGEVDWINAPIGEVFTEWPVLAQNAAAGDYRMVLASADFAGIFNLFANMASQDPQKGPLLSNKDFRVALSHAINRQEIIDLLVTVAEFKGKPAQLSIIESSPYYHEQHATQYTEYDVAKANEILDSLGLSARDSSGYRLGLDGKPLTFQLTIPTYADLWVDAGLLIADYWKAVGLNVEAKAVAPDIWGQMYQTNEIDFQIFSTGAGGMKFLNATHVNSYACNIMGSYTLWGTAYVQYINTNGEKGVEPPEFAYKMNELASATLAAATEEEAAANLKALMDLNAEVFPVMGISRPLPMFCVVTNAVKNGPDNYDPWVIFPYGVGGNVNPCQFYLERD